MPKDKLSKDFNEKFAAVTFIIGVLAGICKLHGLSVFCGLYFVGYYICEQLEEIREIMGNKNE